MRRYLIILFQSKGSGCDHTTGCGVRIEVLAAPNLDDACREAEELIVDPESGYYDDRVAACEVYEVSGYCALDLHAILARKAAEDEAERIAEAVEEEQAELARLKAKYEK